MAVLRKATADWLPPCDLCQLGPRSLGILRASAGPQLDQHYEVAWTGGRNRVDRSNGHLCEQLFRIRMG